ncbi:MAG: NADPH-dependent F420 reductase, partial [Actinomycetota bacterium]
MEIAIVGGTGGLGYGLAVRLARQGAQVVIGSRTAEKAQVAADKARSVLGETVSVEGGANPEVVKSARVVMVTVPFPGQADTYRTIKDSLAPGAAVIDCTVPLASEVGGRATRMIGVWEGSAAQQARGILGRAVAMASAFHTVMAGALEDVGRPLDQDILACGDTEGREAASQIVGLIPGARFIDCGPLEVA